jgi:nucleotidyltransferase substrate binding protein (TIGR01987 family)
MERLNERIQQARRALATLQELAGIVAPSAIERDAAIQRFEYTFEATWKTAKRYLNIVEGLDAASPKAVIRASLEIGLFDAPTARKAMEMVDDRNLTSHTYNEELAQEMAQEIMSRIPNHANVLEQWLIAIIRQRDKNP